VMAGHLVKLAALVEFPLPRESADRCAEPQRGLVRVFVALQWPVASHVRVGVSFHRGVYVSFRGEPVASVTVYGRVAPGLDELTILPQSSSGRVVSVHLGRTPPQPPALANELARPGLLEAVELRLAPELPASIPCRFSAFGGTLVNAIPLILG